MKFIIREIFRRVEPFKYGRLWFGKYYISILFQRKFEAGQFYPIHEVEIIYGGNFKKWMWLEDKI